MRHLLSIALLGLGGAVGAAACRSSAPGPNLRLCALVSGCDNPPAGSFGLMCEDLSLFLTHDPSTAVGPEGEAMASTMECYASATTCAELDGCAGTTPAAEHSACAQAQAGACSGNTLIRCTGGAFSSIDCAGSGSICGSNERGADCGSARCDPGPSRCDGDSIVSCAPGGVLQTTTCRRVISTCAGPPCQTIVADTCGLVNGEAECVGTGDACDATSFPSSCSGSYIVSCTGGRVAAFDCRSTPLTPLCVDDQQGAPRCAAGNECQDDTFPETCSDGVITFCLFGVKTTVQCTDYGFKGCTVLDSAASCSGPS